MSLALQPQTSFQDLEPSATADTEMDPLLEITEVSKTFPGVQALQKVSLKLFAGAVTALIGENGAGKSTLVKILTGIHQPDPGGEIRLKGEVVSFGSADQAHAAGVTAIHQETVLFDELSVAENIFIGHAPHRRFGRIDWATMNREASRILASIHGQMDPQTLLKELSIGQRHLVAIARALSSDAKVVIMDEPTAALSHKEVEDLFIIVETLKAQGKAILFISHKFEDVRRIAERFTVFRDGQLVGHGMVAEASHGDLVRMMVGRDVDQIFPKTEVELGKTILKVDDYAHPTEFDGISFELKKGEILGIYGLIGAGRSELMQAIFGVTRPSRGQLMIEGEPVTITSPADAIKAGIVYVPEERARHGAILPLSIVDNISLPSLSRTSKAGFIRMAEEFALARRYAERLDLRASSLSQEVGTLSGGNQQKVVIGKWLATDPKIIILDEPTKGIDIGSKSAVHAFMGELAAKGLAVIMVSSEIPEILGMSDRVLVVREGRTSGLFDRDGLTPETLVTAATGNG